MYRNHYITCETLDQFCERVHMLLNSCQPQFSRHVNHRTAFFKHREATCKRVRKFRLQAGNISSRSELLSFHFIIERASSRLERELDMRQCCANECRTRSQTAHTACFLSSAIPRLSSVCCAIQPQQRRRRRRRQRKKNMQNYLRVW